jgi:hypothetical protein
VRVDLPVVESATVLGEVMEGEAVTCIVQATQASGLAIDIDWHAFFFSFTTGARAHR